MWRVGLRALIILAVAFLLGFAVYRLGEAYGQPRIPGLAARPFGERAFGVPEREFRGAPDFDRRLAEAALGRERFEGRGFARGPEGFDREGLFVLRGLFGLVNNLLTVTVVLIAVVLLRKGWQWASRSPREATP
jgi:hypothetical protein